MLGCRYNLKEQFNHGLFALVIAPSYKGDNTN